MRNEEECVCSAPSCCDTEQRSASQPACFLPDAPPCWYLSLIWLRVCFILFVVCFVYQKKPRTIDALKANITEEIQAVTADVLARTSQNMAGRVQSCLDANGGHFQHMLWCHISYTMRSLRFKFRYNILISGKIIKEMPGLVASGTFCITIVFKSVEVGVEWGTLLGHLHPSRWRYCYHSVSLGPLIKWQNITFQKNETLNHIGAKTWTTWRALPDIDQCRVIYLWFHCSWGRTPRIQCLHWTSCFWRDR